MDLDSRQLRYVLRVAQDLNFTRAAKQLHVAQQTLSESVGQLERQLGVQLFERSPQRVELTPAGRVFVEHAAELLEQVERTVTATLAAARAAQHTITVGSPDWPTGIELFRRGIDAHRASSEVRIVLDPTPWVHHLDAVLRRRIDVGVTFVPEPGDLPDGLETIPLRSDSSGWVFVADGHPLASAEQTSPEELATYPIFFIRRDDHPPLHDRLAAHLRAHGLAAAPADGGAPPSLANAVAHAMLGDALVWISASMASSPPRGMRAVEVPVLHVPLTLVAVVRRGDTNSRALAEAIAAAVGPDD